MIDEHELCARGRLVAFWPRSLVEIVVAEQEGKKQRLRMASFRSRCLMRICPLSRCYLAAHAGGIHSSGLFKYATIFFAIAFTGQRRFQAALFSGWNIEGVPFDFADDVFLLHFAFESAERALQRLVIAEFDFCHLAFHLPFNKRDWMK
jgi:hypothetical protein